MKFDWNSYKTVDETHRVKEQLFSEKKHEIRLLKLTSSIYLLSSWEKPSCNYNRDIKFLKSLFALFEDKISLQIRKIRKFGCAYFFSKLLKILKLSVGQLISGKIDSMKQRYLLAKKIEHKIMHVEKFRWFSRNFFIQLDILEDYLCIRSFSKNISIPNDS